MFNIVLVAPEIPPNTGNIIRLCANTGCRLHLIEPLGFDISDARLKRAGLDYREGVQIETYSTFEDLTRSYPQSRKLIFSRRYSRFYTSVRYLPDDLLIFGSETAGLPEHIHQIVRKEQKLTLPMLPDNRNLNLSNSVSVVVYEAWRQHGFRGSSR